jgi:hypothetical protein
MMKVGPASPIGKDIAKAIYDLNKHVPAGSVMPAAEHNQLQGLQQRLLAQGPQMAAMKAMQGGPPGGGPPPGLPGGGGPPPNIPGIGAAPPGGGGPPPPPG